jgi:hypothetical protein
MKGSSEIDLPDEQEIALLARAAGQQIEGDIRVAAQAEAGLAASYALGDELRHHIDAAIEHVAQRMGVIGRDVILLRNGDAEARAGLEEELIDLDIRRQPALVLGDGVGEIGIAGEHPLRKRPDEAPFEAGLRVRFLKGQRGEDAQMHRRIGGGAREHRIGDVIGLAEAERQSEHDLLADAGNDRVGHFICVYERGGAAAAAHYFRLFQSGSGRKRSP